MTPLMSLVSLCSLSVVLAAPPVARAADPLNEEWNIDGIARTALIYLPSKPSDSPAPAVFGFHGHGGWRCERCDNYLCIGTRVMTDSTAPCGSWIAANRPTLGTSIGGKRALPPSEAALATVSSQFGTEM